MLNAKKIVAYIVDCLEDYDEDDRAIEAGVKRFYEDYKSCNNNFNIDFKGFIDWQRSCLCFEYRNEYQKNLLINWGKRENEITDIEMDFYAVIWPYFKAILEDYCNGPRVYTVYAEKDDITFIMQEAKINGGKETKVEVIGFYYGEPNEVHTKEHKGKMAAILDI
jgi:hypothetical protein